jgi:hypothetical protein
MHPAPPPASRRNGWELAFAGGLVVTPRWRLGLELGGLGLEASDVWDPSRGESLSQAMVVTDYFFARDEGIFVHAGAGWTHYVNNDAELLDWEGGGWGGEVGVGYALRAGRHWFVSPVLKVTAGAVSPRREQVDTVDYSAISLSVAIGTW